MPVIELGETQQRALRSLMAAEPIPGSPLPDRRVLEQLSVLIPCEGIGVAVADADGYLLDFVDLPRTLPGDDDLRACDGPLPVGFQWASRDPARLQKFLTHGTVDALLIGYRNGPDLVVQLAMDRRGRPFTNRDVALLHLLEPVLERLFRERPTPHLPHLTVQERRVLQLVAVGQSNAEIAARLSIAPCTVRKHLEHIFPKLGVTSRLAAAAAFEGRRLPDPDRVALVERYA